MSSQDAIARLAILNELPVFIEVATRGSFREASDAVGLTPAAVSKSVQRLEAALGVRLLTRTTRRVDLTPEGDVFLPRARAALDRIADGVDALDVLRRKSAGPVRLSCSAVLADVVAGSLPDLAARFPGIDLMLSVSDTLADLPRDGIDIALRVGRTAPGHLLMRRLATLRWQTVASPSYLARHGVPQTPGDLARHRAIVFARPGGAPVPWSFVTPDGPIELLPNAILTVDQGQATVAPALRGHGIVQVFHHMVEPDIIEGRLVPVLAGFAAPGPDLVALTLPFGTERPRIRAALDHVHEVFRRLERP